MMIRRRSFLFGSISLIAGVETARSDEEIPEYSDQQIVDILTDEAEPPSPGVKAVVSEFWFKLPPDKQKLSAPKWPSDDLSYDYSHITSFAAGEETFEISGNVIREYCKRAFFEVDFGKKVAFGLRGCQLANGANSAEFAYKQSVKETRPDHQNLLCLIGILDANASQLALYKASTVPNNNLMDQQINGTLRCNMMPTGLHPYRVGLHSGRVMKQAGALIQQAPLWVHRTKRIPEYTFGNGNEWDDLDGQLPFNDIHAAVLNYRNKPPFFSSAGCQVIAGTYSRGVPIGPWKNFRVSAGLSDPPQESENGRTFQYVLLTGKEAHLIAKGVPDAVKSLRYGSSGAAVRQLQTSLAKAPELAKLTTGVFDRRTLGLYLAWQNQNQNHLTGIVSESEAATLGISL